MTALSSPSRWRIPLQVPDCRALQKQFPKGFDYAGNSRADLAIWRGARRAIVVNARRRLVRAARAQARVVCVIR